MKFNQSILFNKSWIEEKKTVFVPENEQIMMRHEDVLGGSLWRDDGRQVGQAFDHDETVVDGRPQ